jgi:hypothetical protein
MTDSRNIVYAFIDSQDLNLGIKNDIEINGVKVHTG